MALFTWRFFCYTVLLLMTMFLFTSRTFFISSKFFRIFSSLSYANFSLNQKFWLVKFLLHSYGIGYAVGYFVTSHYHSIRFLINCLWFLFVLLFFICDHVNIFSLLFANFKYSLKNINFYLIFNEFKFMN